MWALATGLRSAGHEVHLFCLNPAKHRVDLPGGPPGAPEPSIEAVDVETSFHPAVFLRNLGSRIPYHAARFRSEVAEERLREAVRRFAPDVVQLEGLFLVPYVAAVRGATRAPIVLRALNVEAEIWATLASRGGLRPARLLYALAARRLASYERRAFGDVDGVVAVTRRDAEAFRALGSRLPAHVAPVGIDTAAVVPLGAPAEPSAVCFLGALDWRPNREAVEWFVRRVWPGVIRRRPGARFVVAGVAAPAGFAEQIAAPGVTFAGAVPDAHAFVSRHRALVVPLLSGSGIRVKILQALAAARPVVTTSRGLAGIEATAGEELLVADSPGPFAREVATVLQDDALAARLGERARALAERSYDAARIGRDLAAFYERTFLRSSGTRDTLPA